jgi:hypothetical protein
MKIKVAHNQSLFDIAIMHTGNAFNAIDIAYYNNISVTDNVEGQEINLPAALKINKRIVQHYENKALNPATIIHESENVFDITFDQTFE